MSVMELMGGTRLAVLDRMGRKPAAEASRGDMNGKSGPKPDPQQHVLLVTQDADLTERLRAGFAEKNHFAFRSLKGTLSKIEGLPTGAALPAVAIIDLKTAAPEDLAALERAKRARFAATPVIVMTGHIDQDTVRRLVQIKVDDWLPAESSFTDLYKSCERLARTPAPERRVREAVCYSFFPAAGGAGNTTLAIQAAFNFLAEKRQPAPSVCLVDLNFQDGAVADYLDLAPSFKLEELATAPGRLDAQLLDVMLTRHASGLSVLAAPRLPAKYLEISEGLIGTVLGLLSQSFDYLVVDLPKNWYPWTDNVIRGSNHVYVVTNFTVPALKHARYVVDAINDKAGGTAGISVIVNKHRQKMFGSGLMKKDAEAVLRDWLGGFVPDVPDLVQDAINRGLPMSQIAPGGKVEKALARILRKTPRPKS
jgi:pilus assembly protein CpaE